MQLDQLTLVLRPRSAWEAMELGTALVRQHAGTIWKPWLLLTGSIFIVLNLLGWWLDALWLAGVGLWWLKPAFERIPLYVISRAAFGTLPTTKQTLAAQWHWGRWPLVSYLLWRRWGTARSLLMPVDFLEGGNGRQRRHRRGTLGGAARLQATGLTWVMVHFEWMLQIAGISLVFAFIPLENLFDSVETFWTMLRATPAGLWLALNFLAWAAMSIIGPFYSGAGFGLYLNRRTQLEGWDIEIAFRRLRARLAQIPPLVVVMLITLAPALPLAAQSPNKRDKYGAAPITHTQPVQPPAKAPLDLDLDIKQADNQRFDRAVEQAYKDPKLGSTRTITRWRWRDPNLPNAPTPNLPDLPDLRLDVWGAILAVLSELLLWLIVAGVIVALILTRKRWLPWLSGRRSRPRQRLSAIEDNPLQLPEKLPPDIIHSARRLWRQKQPRHALALLYRAALDVLAQRARITLPAGATESHCLRLAQNMPAIGDRELFAQLVQHWQRAAWAKRVPSDEEFNHLLNALGHHYGWRR